MDVSVIIASFNARDYLSRCLRSLFEVTSDVSFEVIVVDNASRDGTPQLVREQFPQVKLNARRSNAGFSVAINEGMCAATGDHFLILNPDTEFQENVLPAMLSHLRGNLHVALIGPKLLDGDGSLQLSCRAFPDITAALFNRYSLLTRLLPGNRFSSKYLMLDFDHACIADVDWISAACWLVPRTTYERIGPLDERYFWTFEDVDYCQRAKQAGLRVVYFPEVSLVHHIGGSARGVPVRSILARHRGMWTYYRSYMQPSSGVVRPFANALAAVGIAARAGIQIATQGVKRLLTKG
jgi:GT2 family glycosyltransferase